MRVPSFLPALLTIAACTSGTGDPSDTALEGADDPVDSEVEAVDTDPESVDTDTPVETDTDAPVDTSLDTDDTDETDVVPPDDTDDTDDTGTVPVETDTALADTDDSDLPDTAGDTDTPPPDTDDTDILCAPDPYEPDDVVVDLGAGPYDRTDATISATDGDVVHVRVPAGCSVWMRLDSDAGPSDPGTFSAALSGVGGLSIVGDMPLNTPYDHVFDAFVLDVEVDLTLDAGGRACTTYSVHLSCVPVDTGDPADTDVVDTDTDVVPPECPLDVDEGDGEPTLVPSAGGDFSRVLTGGDVDSYAWSVQPGCTLRYEYASAGTSPGTETLEVVIPALGSTPFYSATLGSSTAADFPSVPFALDAVVNVTTDAEDVCLPYDLSLIEDCGDTDVPPGCPDDAYEPDDQPRPFLRLTAAEPVQLDISSGSAQLGPRTLHGDDVEAVELVGSNGCWVRATWDATPAGSPARYQMVSPPNDDVFAIGDMSAGWQDYRDTTGTASVAIVMFANGEETCHTYTLTVDRFCGPDPWAP